jgi:choice-of-anchor A domain-containing protein
VKISRARPYALAALLLASAAFARPAQADAVAAQQLSLLQQFNLIDLGDLNTSSEVEGRMFVGGNESGQLSNVGFNNGLINSPAGYATLTVDGSLNGSANVQTGNVAIGGNLNSANLNNSGGTVSQVGGNVGNVNVNGGTLQYSGAKTGNVNANGGATVQQTGGLTPGIAASTFSTLKSLTSTLDALTANSSVTIANNTATFNAVANASGQAIFDITAAVFGAGQFQFNMNGATSAIINVDGASSITAAANFLGGQAQSLGHELLWNFNAAGSLNINAEFGGTILAPSALVANMSNIDGTLVAGQFNQSGEVHSYDYLGSLPDGTPTAVPEPSALGLLGLGLLSMIALRRRLGTTA